MMLVAIAMSAGPLALAPQPSAPACAAIPLGRNASVGSAAVQAGGANGLFDGMTVDVLMARRYPEQTFELSTAPGFLICMDLPTAPPGSESSPLPLDVKLEFGGTFTSESFNTFSQQNLEILAGVRGVFSLPSSGSGVEAGPYLSGGFSLQSVQSQRYFSDDSLDFSLGLYGAAGAGVTTEAGLRAGMELRGVLAEVSTDSDLDMTYWQVGWYVGVSL